MKSEYSEVKRKGTLKTHTHESSHNDVKIFNMKEMLSRAKMDFVQSLQNIPKNVKQRNELTMEKTLKSLSVFNPFFNRNQKIVNVCLLKVGRIVHQHGGCLYKMG